MPNNSGTLKSKRLSESTKSQSKSKIVFELKKGDTFYLFTDGFADQFGGEKGKKYKYKQFSDLLANLNNNSPIAQKEMIDKTIGVCRFIYNLALQTKIDCYKANGTRLSAFDLCYQLAELKQDYSWMRQVDSQALQASIKKIDLTQLR